MYGSFANNDSKAVYLFANEPYKWEILFQSVLREIANGDLTSIRGMKVLMSTIKTSEQQKIIEYLSKTIYIDESILQKIQDINYVTSAKKNKLKALSILFMIFTNPYGIDLRRNKNHVYEKTGAFFYNIRRKIKTNFS